MWAYLWQNFLEDQDVIGLIIERVKEKKQLYNFDICLEIGPGRWALTKNLVNLFWKDNVYLFEKDKTFSIYLNKIVLNKNIFRWDVIQQDINWITKTIWIDFFDSKKICLVWNIPYYITSPILKKFFVEFHKIYYGIFMVQKEVWEKIKLTAKKKTYLRWLLNFKNNVNFFKTVSASSFNPIPKVDSCLIEVVKDETKNLNINFIKFIKLLNLFSPYTRKTLGRIIVLLKKKWIDLFIEDKLKTKRFEDLTWKEISQIL